MIGDKEINDEFGVSEIKVAIYGGLTVSDNVIEFLKLPSKFRIYERMNLTQGKRRAEESAAGDRWDLLDRKERENNDERLTPDELRAQKDLEHIEKKACKNDVIKLAKFRTTDLPSNKDIILPEPASFREELVIQNKMQE